MLFFKIFSAVAVRRILKGFKIPLSIAGAGLEPATSGL